MYWTGGFTHSLHLLESHSWSLNKKMCVRTRDMITVVGKACRGPRGMVPLWIQFHSVLKVCCVKMGSVFCSLVPSSLDFISSNTDSLEVKTNIQEVNSILRWGKVIPFVRSSGKHGLVSFLTKALQHVFQIYLTSA